MLANKHCISKTIKISKKSNRELFNMNTTKENKLNVAPFTLFPKLVDPSFYRLWLLSFFSPDSSAFNGDKQNHGKKQPSQ